MEAHDPGAERPLDASVIAKLVGSHREFLRFLERRVGSRALAEDILQEAFVKGVERADTLRDDESVVAWFYRILRNAVIDHHRRRGAAERALETYARELEATAEPPPEVADTACACIRELSATLKPAYEEALRRIEIDGLTVQGYAAEIGIDANNAGVRIHRARAALRERVKSSCGTCAEHGCVDCTCGAKKGHARSAR